MTDTTKTGGQTRDTQAIDALIEAVRGGGISTSLIEDAMDTAWQAVMVLAAFDGEMDAALGLLDQLLPASWNWGRTWNGKMFVEPFVGPRIYCEGDNPARALLLATLKAWRDME